MAQIIYEEVFDEYVTFRLMNKPEYLFKIDISDCLILQSCTWYVHTDKKTGSPYIRTPYRKGNPHKHLHREIAETKSEYCALFSIVDHLDNDTTNNRSGNLKIVNSQQNSINRKNKSPHSFYYGEIFINIASVKNKNKEYFQAYTRGEFLSRGNTPESCKEKAILKICQKLQSPN